MDGPTGAYRGREALEWLGFARDPDHPGPVIVGDPPELDEFPIEALWDCPFGHWSTEFRSIQLHFLKDKQVREQIPFFQVQQGMGIFLESQEGGRRLPG